MQHQDNNHVHRTASTHTSSKLIGATLSGLLELFIFHPLDTFTRRLQVYNGTIFKLSQPYASFTKFGQVIMANGSPYSGLFVAFIDKGVKRIYKFMAQGIIAENVLYPHFLDSSKPNPSWLKPVLDASAGAITGVGEVIFQPIDTIKVNQQINKKAFNNQTILQIIYHQNINLYKGATTTVARNFFGSTFLFGISSAIYQYVFKLDNRKQATLNQDIIASGAGAVTAVALTLPFDVIKTRLQKASIHENTRHVSGLGMFKKMIKEEGPSSLFKSNFTKANTSILKLLFGLTVARQVTSLAENSLYPDKKEEMDQINKPVLSNKK